MPVVSEPDGQTVFLRPFAVGASVNVMQFEIVRSPCDVALLFGLHYAFCHWFIILSSSAGVSVSMPSSFASSMIPSINTLISLLSYSELPTQNRQYCAFSCVRFSCGSVYFHARFQFSASLFCIFTTPHQLILFASSTLTFVSNPTSMSAHFTNVFVAVSTSSSANIIARFSSLPALAAIPMIIFRRFSASASA